MDIKYLIRLDDACPTMDLKKWQRIEYILDAACIRPMVGIIPANRDPKQKIDIADQNFWKKARKWDEKGWTIALHGYDHCFISDAGLIGLNPLWARSEFAGLPLKFQKEKIRNGIAILRMNGIDPKVFFAPAHTYDENTLNALREESNIRIVCDTIAMKPYRMNDFIFIPQNGGGHCAEIKIPGIWTFCLHPSAMNDEDFIATEIFLKSHVDAFVGFDNLDLSNLKGKNIMGKLLSKIYFVKRRLKGIK